MSVVHTRLPDENIKSLDQLARAKGSNRSKEIRDAVKMYLAHWTGEPDLNDIFKRLKEVESRLVKVETVIDGLQR